MSDETDALEAAKTKIHQTCYRYWEGLHKQAGVVPGANGSGMGGRTSFTTDENPHFLEGTYRCVVGMKDGTDLNYLLTARLDDKAPGGVSLKVETWTSFHADFWERQLRDRTNAFVAGGEHYRIGPENAGRSEFKGYGGRPWTVCYLDGRPSARTTNLWHQGVVPPQFRDRLPDDATLRSDYGVEAEKVIVSENRQRLTELSRFDHPTSAVDFTVTHETVEVDGNEYSIERDNETRREAPLEESHVWSSEIRGEPFHAVRFGEEMQYVKPGWHTVMLDIDHPAHLLPSSTPGHCHLYIDKPMPWWRYRRLLRALKVAGIIEPGYYSASVRRGATHLRLPWVKKADVQPKRDVDEPF